MSPLEFGEVAPCRRCHGSGEMRGSGLDERQRQALTKAGEPIPTMQPCDECGGSGYVPPAVADAPAPPPAWALSDE